MLATDEPAGGNPVSLTLATVVVMDPAGLGEAIR